MLDRSRTRVALAAIARQIGYGVLALAAACAQDVPAALDHVDVQTQALSAAGAESPSPRVDSAWDYFRFWYALHRRWHRRWRAEPAEQHQCGDAERQGDEQCDDGNLDAGDGCDASCELEDDATTPGDDRPGFVLCASSEDPGLTCSPEQRCCRSPENVCDSLEQDCQRPDVTVGWGDNCDGPEDCEDGLTCVRGKYGAGCTPANPQQGYPVLCHVEADCAFMPETRCAEDGSCVKL
jgi:cysteine-rich repeat protein